jgi:hypothetical protein
MFTDINNSVPVLLYDCSLPLEERKNNKIEFSSIRKAQDYLGISRKQAASAMQKQKRVFSPRFEREFAMRTKSKE